MKMIGKRIADKLREANLSPTDLAKMSGVPQPTIHRIISGESRSPRQHNIEKIAKTLGVSLNWLWTGKKDLVFTNQENRAQEESLHHTPSQPGVGAKRVDARAKLEVKIKDARGSTTFSSLEPAEELSAAIQTLLDQYLSQIYPDEPQLIADVKRGQLTELRLQFAILPPLTRLK